MFNSSTRHRSRLASSLRAHQVAGFADTLFQHDQDDDDYSGFAPTQMFEDELAQAPARASSVSRASRRAESVRPDIPAEESAMPASWVTSRWVEAQEAKASESARRAHAVIAAQRLGERQPHGAKAADWVRRIQMVVHRVLPVDFSSVLPLFICVSLTMALISAVLPLLDKP